MLFWNMKDLTDAKRPGQMSHMTVPYIENEDLSLDTSTMRCSVFPRPLRFWKLSSRLRPFNPHAVSLSHINVPRYGCRLPIRPAAGWSTDDRHTYPKITIRQQTALSYVLILLTLWFASLLWDRQHVGSCRLIA